MTTWAGVEPLQVELSLMFDGWAAHSRRRRCCDLFAVARGDDESPPGVLERAGRAAARRRVGDRGHRLRRRHRRPRTSDARLRQPLTLTLREYVPRRTCSMRRRALAGGKGKTRVVTSRKGDTPAKVARRAALQVDRGARAQPDVVKKANQALKTGTKLRVPVATSSRTAKPKRQGHARERTTADAAPTAHVADPARRVSASARPWARYEQVGLEPELELDELVLNWTDAGIADLDARGALVSINVERTIEGGSTVTMTLADPTGRLFKLGRTTRRRHAALGARAYRVAPVEVDEAGSRSSRPTSSGARWRSSSTAWCSGS
jgi:hypothetical protein